MKFGRTALTVLVAGCALSASAMAEPTGVNKSIKSGVYTAPATRAAAHVYATVQILPNGQRLPVAQNPNGPRPRDPVIGFNNQDCPTCVAPSDIPGIGLNVAYVQPGSYDGSNPSTSASIFGLGDGPAGSSLRAPLNANAVPPIPNPTDIIWNDYSGDATVWPGGAEAAAAVVEYSFVTARQNTSSTVRTDGYRILFFNADGTEFQGGFEFTIDTPAASFFYQQVIIDLSTFDPPLLIPITGLMMVDCPAPAEGQPAVGVGLAFAGGDLVNARYPTPQSLVEVGTTIAGDWLFADGETGIGGPPAVVDPMFDMMEGVSYLDVLNTGYLVDWQFTSAQPGGAIGTRTFAHDFPARMLVNDGTPTTGACVFLAGQLCFVTTEADCAAQGGQFLGGGTVCGDNFGACCVAGQCSEVLPAICTAMGGTFQGDFTSCSSINCPPPNTCPCDWNENAVLNSQDFFDFLSDFFADPPNADYNHDNITNSQDFFDFLGCFFAPPPDCGG